MKTPVENLEMQCLWTGKDGELLESVPQLSGGDTHFSFFDFDMNLRKSFQFHSRRYQKKNFNSFSRPDLDWQEPELKNFKEDMGYLKQCFDAGMAKKAVPVCFATAVKNFDQSEWNFLENSWVENASASYPIFLKSKEFSYIGVSPEILFERKGKVIKTMALAGTRLLDDSFSEEEFLNHPKDSEEHRIVVQSILEDLKGLGELKVSHTYVHKLKTLGHLRTDIELVLKDDLSNLELIHLLHPTPALGVYPKGSLKDWFSIHNKKQDRSLFGAPVLIESGDWARCIVGIRCAFNESGEWKLGSGCGVVSDSKWELEWQELHNKRKSVLDRLGLL